MPHRRTGQDGVESAVSEVSAVSGRFHEAGPAGSWFSSPGRVERHRPAPAEQAGAGRGAVIVTASSADKLDALTERLGAAGAGVAAVPADLASDADRRRLIETAAERFDGLDVLINNAGVASAGHFADGTEAILRQVMEVNFFAPAELMRLAVPVLTRGRRPAVVNIASMCGRRGLPAWTEYSARRLGAVRSDRARAEFSRFDVDVLLVVSAGRPATWPGTCFAMTRGWISASTTAWNRPTWPATPGRWCKPSGPKPCWARGPVMLRGSTAFLPAASWLIVLAGAAATPRVASGRREPADEVELAAHAGPLAPAGATNATEAASLESLTCRRCRSPLAGAIRRASHGRRHLSTAARMRTDTSGTVELGLRAFAPPQHRHRPVGRPTAHLQRGPASRGRLQRRTLRLPRDEGGAGRGRGHRFTTHCDTEIIPHRLEDHSRWMFDHLRGQLRIRLGTRSGGDHPCSRPRRHLSALLDATGRPGRRMAAVRLETARFASGSGGSEARPARPQHPVHALFLTALGPAHLLPGRPGPQCPATTSPSSSGGRMANRPGGRGPDLLVVLDFS